MCTEIIVGLVCWWNYFETAPTSESNIVLQVYAKIDFFVPLFLGFMKISSHQEWQYQEFGTLFSLFFLLSVTGYTQILMLWGLCQWYQQVILLLLRFCHFGREEQSKHLQNTCFWTEKWRLELPGQYLCPFLYLWLCVGTSSWLLRKLFCCFLS